jgi:hypothetical protein
MIGSLARLVLGGRHLLGEELTQAERLEKNCDVPFYADPLQLKTPVTFLVYMIGIVWVIVGIRVVSERYFARAIEGMIVKYKIPSRSEPCPSPFQPHICLWEPICATLLYSVARVV